MKDCSAGQGNADRQIETGHFGRRQRRERELIGQAGQEGGAVAGLHAVVDHFQMRRQHMGRDLRDIASGNTGRENFAERLRRSHGLPCRAPRLERDLREGERVVGQDRDIRRDAIDIRKQARLQHIEIGGKSRLRGQSGVEASARGIADGEPARRRHRVMLADRRVPRR